MSDCDDVTVLLDYSVECPAAAAAYCRRDFRSDSGQLKSIETVFVLQQIVFLYITFEFEFIE